MASLGVLITYYNEGAGLTECLESLVHQPGAPDEILIYDDASRLPAQYFVPKHVKAGVIRGEKNIGPGAGRNILLGKTNSDFIHFHDADDLFSQKWSSEIRRELISADRDAVFTEVSSYESGRLLSERVQGLIPLDDSEALVRFCLRGAILTSAGTYRTSVVRELGGYRECLWQSEDFDFHIRLGARGISFRVLTEPW